MSNRKRTSFDEERLSEFRIGILFGAFGLFAAALILLLPSVSAGWGSTANVSQEDLFGDARMGKIDSSDSGSVLAAYLHSDGLHQLVIVREYHAGTGWGASWRPSSENRTVINFDLSLARHGNASLAWLEDDSSTGWTGVFVTSYTETTGWGPVALVAASNASVDVNRDYRFVNVWVGRSNSGATLVAWREFVNITNSGVHTNPL